MLLPSSRNAMPMSDVTWYSRVLIWTGCALLLLESVLGRSFGYATVLAVVIVAAGLLGFVGGLAVDGAALQFPSALLAGAESETAVEPRSAAPAPQERLQEQPRAVSHAPTIDVEDSNPPVVSPAVEAVAAPAAREPKRRDGATTVALPDGDSRAGAACMSCHQPLRAGRIAAACNECSALHHANCWMENHFHCAREGCSGHGALLAPEDAS